VLTSSELDVIFCCVPELHSAHDAFVAKLEPLVEKWTDGVQVAEPVKVLVSYAVYAQYYTVMKQKVSLACDPPS